MLSARDLRLRYEGADTDALRGVTLDIAPGHVVGIAGRSGSGKSTLLRLLAGQLEPSAGVLAADGHPFGEGEEARRTYRLQVGLAQQLPERQLFAQTVRDDVAFGPHNLGLEDDAVEERVSWALRSAGLDPVAFGERNPFALSGGEARRVALAGVLALRPRYLLLDEPTAGLDPREGERLLSLMVSLAAEGLGVVVVSHDVDALTRICTDAVLMRDGQVVSAGTCREVLGDAERVRACGLLPAAPVELADRLRRRGIPIPVGVISSEELGRALARGEAQP